MREKKGLIMINKNQTKLKLPNGADRLLLHSCCAPCAGAIMEKLAASGIHFTIFFYNPNIHPEKEYLIRKNENIRFAEKLGVPFVDADYDRDNWLARAKGMEYEPSGGRVVRCVLICVLSAQRSMPMKMVFPLFQVLLEFRVGRTWIKSMNAAFEQRINTLICFIGR